MELGADLVHPGQAGGLGSNIGKGAGADGAADAGDDAVGAMVVAALLNLQRGAGVFLLVGDGQVFKGRGGGQRVYGANLAILADGLLQQGHDLATALGAKDHPRAGFQQGFALTLGQTAAEDNLAIRVFTAQSAGDLHGFLIAGAGHGAGVQHVHVRLAVEGDNGIAGGAEKLQHGLGIVLVDFAAKGVECYGVQGFHSNGFIANMCICRGDL